MADSVKVKGYREFLRACDRADKQTKREVRKTFREVGDIVRDDARERFSGLSERTAAGFRTVVRQRGVSVEQKLRKTTGLRPDWGAIQMRKALLPALNSKERQVVREFEQAMDRVADHFDDI